MNEFTQTLLEEVNFERIIIVLVCTSIAYIGCKLKPYAKQMLDNIIEYCRQLVESSKYKHQIEIALGIWYQVEEDYRINNKVIELYHSKLEYFDKMLLEKLPELKQSDIDFIRQSISGKINCSHLITDSII